MSRIIYYYQTFCGLDKILVKNTPVTHIHLSSVHFGLDKNLQQYIHLNDNSPYDYKFNNVWGDSDDQVFIVKKIITQKEKFLKFRTESGEVIQFTGAEGLNYKIEEI